jgi:hypothetical protein
MNSSYILTANALTLFHNGRSQTATTSHRNWSQIIDVLKEGDFDKLSELMAPINALRAFTQGSEVTIEGRNLSYKGEVLDSSLSRRILAMMEEGFDIEPMTKFLTNLMENPSYRAREQLYDFLSACQLPITSDGHFLAYKRVREDLMDLHSGTIPNTVGAVVEMERHKVDDDPNRTCSAGLHVCSLPYLRAFHGPVLLACKVNPRDVVSVPTDYHNSKMRVCRYEVVEQLDMSIINDQVDAWSTSVVSYDKDDDEDTWELSYADDEDDGYSD